MTRKGFCLSEYDQSEWKTRRLYSVCVRGKSDQQNLHQCITYSPLKKNEVDQTVEIVLNEHCLGKGKGESSVQLGTPGLVTICVVLSFLTLGAVAAVTFCLWKRRHIVSKQRKGSDRRGREPGVWIIPGQV